MSEETNGVQIQTVQGDYYSERGITLEECQEWCQQSNACKGVTYRDRTNRYPDGSRNICYRYHSIDYDNWRTRNSEYTSYYCADDSGNYCIRRV